MSGESTKHPWELSQPVRRSKATKEEFEALINKIEQKNDTHKSDMFIKKGEKKTKKPKQKTIYKTIDNVPHKNVNGKWIPLTKM